MQILLLSISMGIPIVDEQTTLLLDYRHVDVGEDISMVVIFSVILVSVKDSFQLIFKERVHFFIQLSSPSLNFVTGQRTKNDRVNGIIKNAQPICQSCVHCCHFTSFVTFINPHKFWKLSRLGSNRDKQETGAHLSFTPVHSSY